MLKTKNKRDSSFELLRIVGMFMIIAHHFTTHGGFKFAEDYVTANELFLQFIRIGGKAGVAVFILISGYFMVTQTSTKLIRLFKLWLQLVTYSVGVYIISCVIGLSDFSFKVLIGSFLPITYNKWWFASVYFVIFLFAPYINFVLCRITKKQYLCLIMIMVVIWWLVPTITRKDFQSNNLVLCVCIYCIAGYIRLHLSDVKINCIIAFLTGTGLYFTVFILNASVRFLSIKFEFFKGYINHLSDLESIFVLAASVFIFLSFSRLKIKPNTFINAVSSSAFGIYLIHDHQIVRKALWGRLFDNAEYLNSVYLIPYACFAILSVFVIFSIVELIRINAVEKLYMRLVFKLIKNKTICDVGETKVKKDMINPEKNA